MPTVFPCTGCTTVPSLEWHSFDRRVSFQDDGPHSLPEAMFHNTSLTQGQNPLSTELL